MTVDAARRTRRRAPRATADSAPTIAPAASIAIGELEQTVFDCPSCSRPLALGARRCPGCRTRIVNGVSLGKASVFVAAGLAIGLLAGTGGSLALGLGRTAGPAPAAVLGGAGASPLTGANGSGNGSSAAPGSVAPIATPAARPTPTAEDGMPPLARSALVQVTATNGRLALAGTGLRAALAEKSFDASAVAQVLRSISADSTFGELVADRVAAWPATGALGAQLDTFYAAVHATAADGLDASVRNAAAYKSAATRMLSLFDEMAAIDAAVQAAAR